MRHYFFGDIHGNNYALDCCQAHIDRVQPDRIYCLGDLVGWLPFGDRTLQCMRSLDVPTVAGNHDWLVAGLLTDYPQQLDRMQASAYNAGLLSTIPGAIDYLATLPLILEGPGFVMVHHSPFHLPAPGQAPTIACFNYLDAAALAGCLTAWRSYPAQLIVSGHDHIPVIYELPMDGYSEPKIYRPVAMENLTIRLQPQNRYWVKAGSVGGPYRDGIPVANSVLYDADRQTVTLYRLPYPTDRLQEELADHRYCANLQTLRGYRELLRSLDSP